MADEAEHSMRDESLEGLLDVVDEFVSPETRETSRANLRVYLEEISRISPLAAGEESTIVRRLRDGDSSGRNRLTEGCLRLVVQVARRYLNRGLSLPDLIEEGNLGLLGAAERYDPERSEAFSTYAVWWIRHAIVHALLEQGRAAQVTIEAQRRAAEEVHKGTEPAASGDPIAMVGELIRKRPDLAGLLDDLAANERTVLRARLGLGGVDPETPQSVAQRLGLSGERVSQIEVSAVRKLRRLLAIRGVSMPGAV